MIDGLTLVVAPHADDESIGCGGTIARLRAEDRPVEVVVVTEPGEAQLRWREFAAAMASLGVAQSSQLGHRERGLTAAPELVIEFERLISARRPALILAPHAREADPDHRVVNRVVRAALHVARLRDREFEPELWEYEVWTSLERADMLVDITAHAATKRAAIACYASQLRSRDYESAALGLNAFRAVMHGRGSGLAEGFRRRRAG